MQCRLMESLFQVMRSFEQEGSAARDYGGGVLLYHAEVNLLDAIYRHPERSASSLANVLGISRGALTQTARKLMDKGLIEQYSPVGNRKVKYHRLTQAGETVRQGHARFHAQSNARMQAYLCDRTLEEKQVLHNFFEELQACLPICLYDCEKLRCDCHLTDAPSQQEEGGGWKDAEI